MKENFKVISARKVTSALALFTCLVSILGTNVYAQEPVENNNGDYVLYEASEPIYPDYDKASQAFHEGYAGSNYDDDYVVYEAEEQEVPACGIGLPPIDNSEEIVPVPILNEYEAAAVYLYNHGVNELYIENYKGCSIVEAFKANGYESSFEFRKNVAIVLGVENYRGTAAQNIYILSLLEEAPIPLPLPVPPVPMVTTEPMPPLPKEDTAVLVR